METRNQATSQSQDGFDPNWEEQYAENTHLSIWPWSDVVSYINRYLKPKEDYNKILELGCGAGANIPLFLSRHMEYHAIEGSETITTRLQTKFPNIAKKIVCGDFTKSIPFNFLFDVVLDRASLTHNDTKSIERCLEILKSKIRKNGVFIGIDWFSNRHPDSQKGVVVDKNTRRDLSSRQFKGLGNVHFEDQEHLIKMFTKFEFEVIVLEHKENTMLVGSEQISTSQFNFVAKNK
jgi:SAM-dependent methyltransferase